MSILGFLFPPDPTRGWREYELVPLVYDFASGELNGIAAGAPLDRLRSLGKPGFFRELTQFSTAACYPTLGLEIELTNERVDSFACRFQRLRRDRRGGKKFSFHPCEIELRRADGESVRVTADTTLEEVQAQLGSGAVHRDDDGSVLQVRTGDVWLYFDFDPDGYLRVLDIEPGPELMPP